MSEEQRPYEASNSRWEVTYGRYVIFTEKTWRNLPARTRQRLDIFKQRACDAWLVLRGKADIE